MESPPSSSSPPGNVHVATKPVPGILVVDDEPLLVEALSLVLIDAGYEVFQARDGFEGLAVYGDHAAQIVAVVLDLSMPHTRGEVVLSMMRSVAPHLPILISTGSPVAHLLADPANADGRVAYLMKPYAPPMIWEGLSGSLKRRFMRVAEGKAAASKL